MTMQATQFVKKKINKTLKIKVSKFSIKNMSKNLKTHQITSTSLTQNCISLKVIFTSIDTLTTSKLCVLFLDNFIFFTTNIYF